MAAMPVSPEPEIAPVTAQLTAATTPSPPRTWPTNALTNRKRLAAMPLALITVPASTKSGIANRTGLDNC